MALTQAQIRHIANLSRLTIDESSLPKYEKDLNAIVGYVDILNKVNPDELASINTKEWLLLPLREDMISGEGIGRGALLGCSPHPIVNDQIAIDNIMK